MMNTLKEFLVAGFLVLSIGAGSNVAVAAVSQVGMAQPINNTITHLEAALKAVNANELEMTQEHIKPPGNLRKTSLVALLNQKNNAVPEPSQTPAVKRRKVIQPAQLIL
ncbi:hypothetical protein [Immundisolibacter sp.]